MGRGESEELWRKLRLGTFPKPPLHDLADVRLGGRCHLTYLAAILPDAHHSPLPVNDESGLPAIDQDSSASTPTHPDWFGLTSQLLSDPLPARFEEGTSIPFRAPAGQRHTNRAVRQHPQDVAARSTMTYENDGPRLRDPGICQRQTELHRGLP